MRLPFNGVLLRILTGEDDRYNGVPVYEQIVLKARELNMAGATVCRGIMGFGANSHLHTTKLLRLSDDLPVVIEIVDTEENIKKLLPYIDEIMSGGIVTMEKMRILRYMNRKESRVYDRDEEIESLEEFLSGGGKK